MVKKMVKKKNKNVINNVEEFEDLEKAVDLEDLISTSMKFPKADLKKLKIKSATEGISMAGILRNLLKKDLKNSEKIRNKVESNLYNILKDSTRGWFSNRFELEDEGFIDKMLEAKIKLSDLNDNEWSMVLDNLSNISSDYGDLSADDVISKLRCLNPTKSQISDIKDLFLEAEED